MADPDFQLELLKPDSGDDFVDAGETPNLTATLYDNTGDALNKSAIKTLTLSIWTDSGTVINSRDGVNVLDANDCTVTADGVVTIRFAPDDMAYQASEGLYEYHIVQLQWTWDDSESVERVGMKKWRVPVRRHAE